MYGDIFSSPSPLPPVSRSSRLSPRFKLTCITRFYSLLLITHQEANKDNQGKHLILGGGNYYLGVRIQEAEEGWFGRQFRWAPIWLNYCAKRCLNGAVLQFGSKTPPSLPAARIDFTPEKSSKNCSLWAGDRKNGHGVGKNPGVDFKIQGTSVLGLPLSSFGLTGISFALREC
jgi:hypothetical protein